MRALGSATVLAAVFAVGACASGSESDVAQPDPTRPSTSTPALGAPRTCTNADASTTPIRIRFGATTLTGLLNASPTARALRDRLPITADAADYGGVEKTAEIPALPMTGMPAGADPGPGTLGYYAPDRVLVLYYGDVGYFPGIADLGRFDDPENVAAAADGPVTATIELGC